MKSFQNRYIMVERISKLSLENSTRIQQDNLVRKQNVFPFSIYFTLLTFNISIYN